MEQTNDESKTPNSCFECLVPNIFFDERKMDGLLNHIGAKYIVRFG